MSAKEFIKAGLLEKNRNNLDDIQFQILLHLEEGDELSPELELKIERLGVKTGISRMEALTSAFSNIDKLKLFGGAILIEKTLRGFTLGSFLNPETACIHFMFGDPDLPGISQALLFEACNKTFSKFKYLNLEQDLGIPGLRTSKLSYHPLRLEKKFNLRPLDF